MFHIFLAKKKKEFVCSGTENPVLQRGVLLPLFGHFSTGFFQFFYLVLLNDHPYALFESYIRGLPT